MLQSIRKKNTLVLFRKIEHGRYIEEELLKKCSKKIYYIDGSVSGDDREVIRKQMELEDDAILVSSYGTMAVGVNIKNLHTIIFSSSYKSKIKVLQSIGRGLRVHGEKSETTLVDIYDDLNVFLKHYEERKSLYEEEKFDVQEHDIDLKKWSKDRKIEFF